MISERPEVIWAALLGLTALLAAFVIAAVGALGGCDVVGLAASALGAVTACLVFVHELERVPVASPVLAVISLASLAAFLHMFFAAGREQLLLHRLPARPADGPLARLAEAAAGCQLAVLPAARPDAFCHGLLRPRLVVTSGLLARLDSDEQAAVLWHEAYHARSREPLKLLVARMAAATFFWMPLLRDLLDRYLLTRELAADRLAIARTSPAALAGALCEALAEATPAGALGIGDRAGARIERLFDPGASLPPLFRRRRLAASVAVAAALTVLIALPAQIDLSGVAHVYAVSWLTGHEGLASMLVAAALITATRVLGTRPYPRRRAKRPAMRA
jgi:Zn-dependent protease with chaperone function